MFISPLIHIDFVGSNYVGIKVLSISEATRELRNWSYCQAAILQGKCLICQSKGSINVKMQIETNNQNFIVPQSTCKFTKVFMQTTGMDLQWRATCILDIRILLHSILPDGCHTELRTQVQDPDRSPGISVWSHISRKQHVQETSKPHCLHYIVFILNISGQLRLRYRFKTHHKLELLKLSIMDSFSRIMVLMWKGCLWRELGGADERKSLKNPIRKSYLIRCQ